ncbi:MAG: VOC family protein [Lachnospiraceae bacterium]|nr:VOC family protein [Lachnospiraceae bacterium]
MLSIHHMGYLVRNMEKALDKFEELGYKPLDTIIYDEGREAAIQFLEKDGYRIELVCPEKTSDIYPFLKRTGSSPYHICYETDDLDAEISRFEAMGYTVFLDRAAAPAIGEGSEVVFLYHFQMGIVELVSP